MKHNLLKTNKRMQSGMQFNTILALSIALLTVVGFTLFENKISSIFAQTDTTISISTNNNTNTSLSTNQQQQSSFHPQVVLIIEEQGKITNQRVLEVNPHPKIESTFVANQTILGDILAHDLGTYWATLYTNGSVHGEGHGISTTTDGERVTWTGEGVGTMSSQGDLRLKGSLFFHTSSTGEISYLNNKVGFFNYEVDSEGNTSASVWELR